MEQQFFDSPLRFNFAPEYVISKNRGNQLGLKI
jgi:hypothetical protein